MHVTFKNWDLANKNVFLRIDGNVPINDGKIINDFKLRALIPTLNFLKHAHAHVTIATHIGNPNNPASLHSTDIIQQWLNVHGYGKSHILENLRLDPGELNHDQQFAQHLAKKMDFYINDAWGTLHRNDTSLTVLPQLFSPEKRSLGLLVEREINALAPLKNNPDQPYLLLLGGNKLRTKLPLLKDFIVQNKITTIALLPAIAYTFLKALNKNVGQSLIDLSLLNDAQEIIQLAYTNNIELILPVDFLYKDSQTSKELKLCSLDNFPDHGIGVTIGPKSKKFLQQTIEYAKTILYNGLMGYSDIPNSLEPVHELFTAIANSKGYSIIGGGESITEVERLNLTNKINFCSTGGGSTLCYISGKKLPGLL